MPAAPNLFNVGALFILLRETLEVVIVLAVLFNFIAKAFPKSPVISARLRKMVWLGSLLGLVLSIAIGIAFTVVFYILRQNIFESFEPLWEGCFKLIAAIMLTWIAFSMLNVEGDLHSKWENKLKREVEKAGKEDPDASEGLVDEEKTLDESKAARLINRPWGLFILAFTVIIREGLECVIFLTGVGQGEPYSIIIPGILGILIGGAIGVYFWKRTNELNMKKFLIVSVVILLVLSAGLLANAAHEFEEFGYLQAGAAEQGRLNDTLPPNITAPAFVGGRPNLLRRFDTSIELPQLTRRQAAPTTKTTPPKRVNATDAACPRLNATSTAAISCTVRTYYIAAVEVNWDYAPSGYNHFNGVPFVRDPEGAGLYVLHSDEKRRLGSVYKKAIYVEYTDETFKTEVAKPEWLGFLGPLIRAEVGDVIKIKFKNTATLPFTMHPHGVFYTGESEGAHSEWRGAAVQPGETYDYTWSVPERAGPGPSDGSSVFWAYHSHQHEVRDVYSGLVGPMVIYSKGTLDKTTDLPTDFDHEYVLYLSVVDETKSWYIEQNILEKLALDDPVTVADLIGSDEFIETNLKHTINGRFFNNLDGFRVEIGESVKWHAMAMGTEVDLHTLHFHGMTGLEGGHRTDVVELLPASFKSISMKRGDLITDGSWLIHCHVADHITAGMISSFYVAANKTDAGPSWTKKGSDNEFVLGVAEFRTSTPVLWNAGSCCSEEDNPFFQILNALIGWRAEGTVATVVTYFGYWFVVIGAIIFLKRRADKKKSEEEALELKEGDDTVDYSEVSTSEKPKL